MVAALVVVGGGAEGVGEGPVVAADKVVVGFSAPLVVEACPRSVESASS